jgi:hypothetical protein
VKNPFMLFQSVIALLAVGILIGSGDSACVGWIMAFTNLWLGYINGKQDSLQPHHVS